MEAWVININRIAKERARHSGVKLGYLAKLCGYTPKKFSELINGHKLVTAEDIAKVCFGFGVTPNELFGHISVKADQQPAPPQSTTEFKF